MKSIYAKKTISISIILIIILSSVYYYQKNIFVETIELERRNNLEEKTLEELIVKKEISFRAKRFTPKKWDLLTHNKIKIKGSVIFNNASLLVYRILPYSCSSCIENELKFIEQKIDSNLNLKDKIIIITSFLNYSEFKSFYDNYKPRNIKMYNQVSKCNEWEKGTSVYFLWKHEYVSNLYVPRLNNKDLNSEYFKNIRPLIEEELDYVLFIINGKEYLKPMSYLDEIEMDKIETITSLNSNYGLQKYGKKGQNGVYQIDLKLP